MTTDALAAALAAEEHRQGRPYTADPEHCAACKNVDWAWEEAVWRERQTRCTHADTETIELHFMDRLTVEEITTCRRCGFTTRGVRYEEKAVCE